MKRTDKKGFTIVELVIVIAVIAILAAVLIPNISKLVRKANESNARAEAKNLITEMLADILTGKDGDADLLVLSNKGKDVYVYGYSRQAGRVIAYCENPKAIPSGKSFAEYVEDTEGGLLKELTDKKVITPVEGLAADDWRQPAKTKEIVEQLDSKGGNMLLFANYNIAVDSFLYPNALTVNGKTYATLSSETFSEAVKAASEGDTITLFRNTTESIKFNITEPTTLKNITFKAADGVTIKGLQLASTSGTTRLTLDDIKFEGISFTDKVVIGQDKSEYGRSQCSNITFENCSFDLAGSTEKYPDAIKRMGGTVSGTISEKEAVAYLNGLTIKKCTFKNVRYGVFVGLARNVTIEDCQFSDCSSYAVRIDNIAGDLAIRNNIANNTGGFLTIGTVGNNYSTTNITTRVSIANNTATNMTCKNGDVFMTTFDNARKAGKSTYEINGNVVTYTEAFDTPLNGFRIKSTYGPSVAEFIKAQ